MGSDCVKGERRRLLADRAGSGNAALRARRRLAQWRRFTRRTPKAMPIYYPDILDQRTAARTFTYGDKDVMLYALGIGLGADPMDEQELAFVYERNLKIVPTAATVLAANNNRAAEGRAAPQLPEGHRQSTMNFLMMVHGEQKVELHKPLPVYG